MQNISIKEKKIRTNIKAAQGSFALSEILAVIYIFKVCISRDFAFYFSTFGSEFILKSSELAPDYPGTLSSTLAVILVLLYNAIFIAFVVLTNKDPGFLRFGLTLYLVDTVWMAVVLFSQYLEPFTQEKWIDIIVHAFILVFLIVGTDAVKKLKKLENKPKTVHRKKYKKKKK